MSTQEDKPMLISQSENFASTIGIIPMVAEDGKQRDKVFLPMLTLAALPRSFCTNLCKRYGHHDHTFSDNCRVHHHSSLLTRSRYHHYGDTSVIGLPRWVFFPQSGENSVFAKSGKNLTKSSFSINPYSSIRLPPKMSIKATSFPFQLRK